MFKDSEIKGSFDRISNGSAVGWIVNLKSIEDKLSVNLLCDGKFVASCIADGFRPDVKDFGIGDGYCGFSLHLPEFLFDGHEHLINICEPTSHIIVKEFKFIQQPDAALEAGKRKAKQQDDLLELIRKTSNLFFDSDWYLQKYPFAKLSIAQKEFGNAFDHYSAVGKEQDNNPSPFFDCTYYRDELKRHGVPVNVDLLELYLRHFGKDEISPHWIFDPQFYFNRYPDIQAALARNKFASGFHHFLTTSEKENRYPNPLFSKIYYLQQVAKPISGVPLRHFLDFGQFNQISPSVLFDLDWYQSMNQDLTGVIGKNKNYQGFLHHFLCKGIFERRSPVPDFDEQFYLKSNSDVAQAVAENQGYAIQHWLCHGASKFRDPNKYFDSKYYLEKNPDVKNEMAKFGILSAFEHFLWMGKRSGLRANVPLINLSIEEDAGKVIFARRASVIAENIRQHGGLSIPGSAKPEISFVVPVFNEINFTLQVLSEIKIKTDVPYEVIIVDDASTDETSKLEEIVKGIKVIHLKKNSGFPAACNVGWRAASASVVGILNNDIEIGIGAVEFALATMHGEGNIGAVGGRVIRSHGMLQEAGCIVWADGAAMGYGRDSSPTSADFSQKRDVDFCSACFLILKKKVLEDLNGFDESFSPGYYEETDLCARIWQSGMRVVYEPKVYVYHFEYASFSKARPPSASIALIKKHREKFIEKNKDFLVQQNPYSSDLNFHSSDRKNRSKKWILVIEDLVPLPRLGSGFGRTNQIINTFLGLDYAVTVFVKSDRIQVESSELIQHLPGVKLIYAKDEHTLENFIEKNHTGYDVIWVCRTHSIKLVNNAFRKIQYDAGRPKLILDTEAIASTRDYTLSQILDGPAWTKSMFHDAAASELDGNSVFDHVVLVNEFEKDLVDEIIAPRKTDLLRLKFDNTNIFPVTKSSWSKRTSFLFAGAVFDESSPNYDSLKWFVYKIWPEVRKEIPTARLNICGHWEPRLLNKALELATVDGIQFMGSVNDLDTQYNACRVFIAPTRFGAGIPVKIQESVNFGLPVVTTPLMARQLGWNAGQGILFDSSKSGPEYASQFAKDCVRLYSDYDLWKTTRSEGVSVVKRDCNEELFKRNIMNILSH